MTCTCPTTSRVFRPRRTPVSNLSNNHEGTISKALAFELHMSSFRLVTTSSIPPVFIRGVKLPRRVRCVAPTCRAARFATTTIGGKLLTRTDLRRPSLRASSVASEAALTCSIPIMPMPLPLSLGGCTASCRLFSLARGGVAFLLFTFPVTTARPGFQVRAVTLCVWYMGRFGVCPVYSDSGGLLQ